MLSHIDPIHTQPDNKVSSPLNSTLHCVHVAKSSIMTDLQQKNKAEIRKLKQLQKKGMMTTGHDGHLKHSRPLQKCILE